MISKLLTGGGRWRYLMPVVAAGAFLAACSSSSSPSATPAAPATPAPSASSSASGSGGAGGAAGVTVKTQTGPLGTYLVDGSGRTLYLFETDTGPISACNGVCAQAWPPLGATGTPQAGAGVTQADLTTTKRADGTMQIDYHNHPLYTFAMDTAAGQTKGQGVNFEGLWWVVAPNGTAITKAATSGTAPSTAPGGGTGY